MKYFVNLIGLLLILWPLSANAEFYIHYFDCKVLVVRYDTDDQVQLKKGDILSSICEKNSNTVACQHYDTNMKPFATTTLNVMVDSIPEMYLFSDNSAEIMYVNTSTKVVTLNNRLMGEGGMGSKICKGTYMTKDDLKEYDKLFHPKNSPGKNKTQSPDKK